MIDNVGRPCGGQPYPGLAILNNNNENVSGNFGMMLDQGFLDKVKFHVKNTGIHPQKLIYGEVDMIKNI